MRPNKLKSLLLLLLCAGIASAQVTTIGGNIKDLTGAPVTTGKVVFTLNPGADAAISGVARFSGSSATCGIYEALVAGTALVSGSVMTVPVALGHPFQVGDWATTSGFTAPALNQLLLLVTATSPTQITLAAPGVSPTGETSTTAIIGTLRGPNNGTTPGFCNILTTTALTPPGSWYRVDIWPGFTRTSSFTMYTQGNNIDLSTVVPTPSTVPYRLFVDTISNQTLGGIKTFSLAPIFSSGVSMNGVLKFPNSMFTDSAGFAGQTVWQGATGLQGAFLYAIAGTGSVGHGGDLTLFAGPGQTGGGNVNMQAGSASAAGLGGNVSIQAGGAGFGGGIGGGVSINGGSGTTTGGNVNINSGPGGTTPGNISMSTAGQPISFNGFPFNFSTGVVNFNAGVKFVKYAGITTPGLGIPVLVGNGTTEDLTGQISNLAPTAIYTPVTSGFYRISTSLTVTTVGTTSTLPAAQVNWSDADNSTVQSRVITATASGNTLTTTASGTTVIWAKALGGIQIQTTGYASTGTPMQYAIHTRVEAFDAP